MSAERSGHRRANPFSTRFVRPGAMSFLFEAGDSAADVVRRLAELGWRAQIVGPHGSGKSTLLASLVEPLRQAGRPAHVVLLRDGQRRLPAEFFAQARRASAGTIVVDGYEQLGTWSRLRLWMICRQRGWGFLVTTHDDVGLPTLVRLAPRVEVAEAVVRRLLGAESHLIPREVVHDALAAAGGNVRELLFALYDRHESETAAARRRGDLLIRRR